MANAKTAVKAPKTAKRVAGQFVVVDTLQAVIAGIIEQRFGKKTFKFAKAVAHELLQNAQEMSSVNSDGWRNICLNAGLKSDGLLHVAKGCKAELEIRSFIKGEEYTDEAGNTYKSGYRKVVDTVSGETEYVDNDETVADGTELHRLVVTEIVLSANQKEKAELYLESAAKTARLKAQNLSKMSSAERVLYGQIETTTDPERIMVLLDALEKVQEKNKAAKQASNSGKSIASNGIGSEKITPEGDETED